MLSVEFIDKFGRATEYAVWPVSAASVDGNWLCLPSDERTIHVSDFAADC